MRDEQMSSESLIKELNILRRELSDRKRSEQVAADFLDQAPMAIHWVGPDGLILWANKAELQMLGYTSEEFFGHHIADFHVEKPVIDDILKRLASAETLNNYPAQLRCKDGSVKKVMINSNVRWEDGKFIHTRCFTRDVTEHAVVVEELRQADERLRIISMATSDVVWDWDIILNHVFWGNNFQVLFGHLLSEIAPGIESWYTYIHPDDKNRVIAGIKEALAQHRSNWSDEYRFRCKDGSYRNIFDRGYAIYDQDGKAIRMIGAMVDITDRKQAEHAQLSTAALLERIGAMAKIGGWELDLQTMKLFWSLETCRIHEIDSSVAPALEQAINFYTPEAQPVITAAVQAGIEHGTPWDLELPLITAKGCSIWVRAHGSPVREDGRVVKLFGAFQDITVRKLAEEDFKKNIEELKLLLAITVDRENTMINLKKEVNALALELKRPQPYDVSFLANE